MELRARLRGRQHRAPPGREGWVFPGAAGGFAAGHSLGHVPGHGGDGRARRGAPPRGGDRRPVRDRHALQHLVRKADELQMLKYCVHNVAHAYGKTATFMPKPLVGTTATACMCTSRCPRTASNVFAGDKYAGLSQTALHTSAASSSMPGAERVHELGHQQLQALGAGLRGARAARLLGAQPFRLGAYPARGEPEGAALEVRFPDSNGNPYFTLPR